MTRTPAALAAAFILAGPNAYAQTASASSDLDTVTVTAARGGTLQSLEVSTTTVSPEAVQAAPEPTLDQLVGRIPGVFTSQVPSAELHPTGQEFNIRGFGTTTNVNTLVMADGVPLNDPYFRTVDWSQLPKAEVEDIEVIRGGGGASLWGNMAMGGVVNVITRTPGPDDDELDVSTGGFDTVTGDAALGVAPTDQLRLGVTADLSKTEGYDQTPARYRSPFMDATASQASNFTVSADYAPTDDARLYVKFLDHRIFEDGLVWSIASNAWTADRATFGGSVKLDGTTSLNVSGWYGANSMSTVNASDAAYTLFTPLLGTPYVSQTETARYDNYGGSAFVSTAFGPIEAITAGIDFRAIVANDPLNLFSATAPTGSIDARAQHRFQGLFAQGSWRPAVLPLEVTVGLREDFWQTADGRIAGLYQGSAFAETLPNQIYSRFDPRLGAKYHLTGDIDLRAAVYEAFAAPGMNQMYRAFISGANYTASNPSLRPQTNLGEEAGVDLRRGPLTLSATAFTNTLSGFIDYATVQSGCAAANAYCGTGIAAIAGGALRQYVNAGQAVLQGFEALAGWKAGEGLDVEAGFTRTDAQLVRSNYALASAGVVPDPIGEQIGQVPPWTATASLDWRPVGPLTVSLTIKSFPAYWNNTSHTQLNQGATLADLGASWRLSKRLELFALVQNVGDVRYYDQGLGYTTTGGPVVSGSTTPALGPPLDATVGARARF